MVSVAANSPTTPAPAWRQWFWAVALVLLVFAAYQPVWRAGFIWDDDRHLTRPELRSAAGLGQIWTDLKATQQYYPLTHSAFWVQYHLFGINPLPYHLVNVALHATNAVLVLLLLRRLGIPGAALAAAVFALHPVLVESVAWVAELKNTLSGLFYLTAALVYLRFDQSRQRRWYALALGLFVLGLLSKTVTASLPAALLVVFWWQRGRLTWRGDVRPLLPFFGLGAAAGLTTAWVEHALLGARGATYEFTVLERGLIAGRVVWFYLGKLLWPAELIFIYPRWEISQTVWWQYVYPLVALVVLGVAWQARHRSRAPLAALLFFGGTLFPALGFVNVYPFRYSFVADHFQYLASLGIITLAAAGVTRALARWRIRNAARRLVGVGALAVLATLTWRQTRIYHDLETLWRDTLAKNPACWLAHNNLGVTLNDQGQLTEARHHYAAAVRLNPDFAEARYNLGSLLARRGRWDEAIGHYTAALRLKPGFADWHYNLGVALAQQSRLTEALAQYTAAVRLQPDFAEAHHNLGSVLVRLGRLDEAIAFYTEALRLKPNESRTHRSLGKVLADQGKLAEAITHYTQALRLKPNDADTHIGLGVALVKRGQITDALPHFTAAIQADPNFADAYTNRGNARLQAGQLADALTDYQAAVRLQPESPPALNNLAWLQATAADPALRDAAAAVRLAECAADLTQRRAPDYLDTLAAAYAAAGRWSEAVTTAEQALALARAVNQTALAAEIRARLEQYRAGRAWQEPGRL